MDDGWCFPPRLALFQLGFVYALGRYALGLNPIVDLLDLLNCDRTKFCFHPWRYARERWAAIDVDVQNHGTGRILSNTMEVSEDDQNLESNVYARI